MKSPILLATAAFCLVTAAVRAAVIIPFDVDYSVTNYAASASPGSGADLASGLWLGNLRGQETWRDLIVANKGSNTVSIRLCNDNGTFRALTNFPVGIGPTAVRSGILNGDAFEDIVVANSGTNTVTVLLNDGLGRSFTNASEYTVGATASPEPTALAIGDANADGESDILVVNASENSVSVLTNAGSGTFAMWTDFSVGTNPRSILFADFNNDSNADILTANKTAGTLTILYKQFGVFGSAQTITLFPGGDPQPVAALSDDFNGDGYRDIVTANYNSNNVSILLNNGAGAFSVYTNYDVGNGPVSLVLRDLNRDGKTDIAVANEGSGTVNVLLSYGDGTFATGYTINVGSSPAAIAGSNFDPGNFNDLAVANNGDNTVSIVLYSMPLVQPLTYTLLEDSNKVVQVSASVFPGRTATYTVISAPTNGVLSGTAPNYLYTPNTNFFGTDTFTFKANDGFVDSEEATVTIRVLPVNDAPSFSASTNQVLLTKFGVTMTVTNFITTFSPGPANESGQTVSYAVSTTNAQFFASQPAIKNGNLVFRAAGGVVGTNTITIRAVDNGGTSYGGTNRSPGINVGIVVPPNPFVSVKGLYNGLFYETNEVKYTSAGLAKFLVTSNGAFSGSVFIGRSYSFNNQFDATSHAQFSVSRGTNVSPLVFDLNFDTTVSNPQITGTISDGGWTSTLLADFAPYNIFTNPAPQAGRYTLAIAGGNNSATSPGGSSYGFVYVDDSGKVRVSGMLADKRSFSQSASISGNGQWPLYVPLNDGNGALVAWLTFTNETTSSLKGNVTWIKGVIPYNNYYAAGFTNITAASGSTYIAPTVERILDVTNTTTRLIGALLPSNLTNTVTLNATNTFTITGGQATKLTLRVNLVNGNIYGSFIHPTSLATISIRGVVLQKQNRADGTFFDSTRTGSFVLNP